MNVFHRKRFPTVTSTIFVTAKLFSKRSQKVFYFLHFGLSTVFFYITPNAILIHTISLQVFYELCRIFSYFKETSFRFQ